MDQSGDNENAGFNMVNKKPLPGTERVTISSVLACLLEIMRKIRCRGRTRTSTRRLAVAQCLWWSTPVALIAQSGITLRLSRDPHPRDKRACLPKIPSLHNLWLFKELNWSKIKGKAQLVRRFQRIFLKLSKLFKYLRIILIISKNHNQNGSQIEPW